ncbi:autotransporter domain-containing protein [Sutterella wadsworthensis]|uniref:autotransporter domain-containing protein n=1 Tax=Sutterella wadsworthensis TaxID=40545 RepID=UPI00266B9297|nr:autotransporter domain-containing protein [Sutterella wadsworthensis]
MNRNFKVVFSKARGALMVVNEATSSVQAKGTKTVIAAAVAALSLGAGVASAADSQTFDDVQLNANTTLTITNGESDFVYTPTGTVTGTVGDKTDQTFAAKGDSLNTDADVILNGGDFAVDASGASKDMTVAVGQLGIQKATDQDAEDIGTGAGNITLTANSVADKETPVALTLNASSIDLQAGTIAFKAGEKANQGAITLNSTGDIVLGTAQSSKQFGAVTETTPAVDRNIIVDAGLEVEISATEANFYYNAGTVTNAGTLKLAATKNADNTGAVTLGEDVSFVNSGTVAIEGDTVTLNASYDATSEANKSGYLEVKSTAASDGTITVGGTLTADTIKLGTKTADAEGKRQEKNQIVLDAETTTVAKDGKLDVKNTLTLEKNLTVQGIVNAAATDVKAKDVAMNIDASDAAANKYAGSVSLGKVTVGAGTAQDANSLRLSVTNGASAQADSLDIAAEDKDKNKAGEFALVTGKFNAGTLTNGGSVSIGDTGSGTASTVGTLTVSGTSVNKGTVTFGTAVKDTQNALVIAADSTFSNEGKLGADSGTTGDITVAGTLTNVLKAESSSGKGDGITGKINANAVNVKEGGVVNTALDNYNVDKTTVDGTFATTLNKLANGTDAGSGKTADALELKSAFVVNGGAITDGTNEVTNYVIGDNGSLTLNSDKKLTSVLTNQTTALDDAFTVGSAASVEVGTLTLTKGHALVEGDLTVTTALNTTTTDGTIKVSDGDLTVSSLDVLGLEIKNGEIVKKTGTTVPSVADDTITLEDASSFNLDLGEVTFANKDKLSALTGLVADNADGLINVGNVTITGLISDKNEITYADLKDLNGLTTDAIKQVTVTGADTIDRTISVGNLKIAGNTTTGASSIEDGKTVTLNGSGMLVYYDKPTTGSTAVTQTLAGVNLGNGSTLVVAAAADKAAEIGAVEGEMGNFHVESGSLTVKGNVNVADLTVEAGSLTLGAAAEGADAYTITAATLDVQADAVVSAAANSLTLTGGSDADFTAENRYDRVNTVAGSLAVKTLETAHDLLVTGTAQIDTLKGDGAVLVGTDESAGSLVVNTLEGKVFADPAWVDGKSEAASTVLVKAVKATGSVEAGRNSVVTVGGEKAFTADEVQALTGFTLAETPTADNETTGVKAVKSIDTYTVNSVVVLGGDKTTVMNGTIVASNSEQPSAGQYQVRIDGNSMLVVDALKLDTTGETALFAQQTSLADGSILFIDNAANGQKFLLSKANGTSYRADAVFEGNLLMEESYNKDSNTLSIGMTDKSEVVDKLGDVAGLDAIYGMYEKGENVGNTNAQFFRDLMSSQTSSAYDKTTGEWNFQTLRTTLNDVAAIGATTGAQAVTMDAVNQMADTVAARTSVLTQRAQGVNVWVDVNGGRFEGKKVMDGAGYSSDIYAGTLGADYQFANGAVLGAALTIGTADTDSKGTTAKTSMDSDLVGFSVYGSKTFADIWNVAGDIGYLQASNDVTESGYGFGDFSEDVNAFTLGVRGEVLTKAGSVNIVPHLGLRYTRLSTDSFKAGFNTEIDDQNIFQMPVGVTVSADFETSGWTIAPKFDLSVVPTFGDKDADLKLGITGVSASDDLSVRVIDSNPVQATLGVSATNGAWGFGLNYKLGVGSDDRMNNSFNANVRYAF